MSKQIFRVSVKRKKKCWKDFLTTKPSNKQIFRASVKDNNAENTTWQQKHQYNLWLFNIRIWHFNWELKCARMLYYFRNDLKTASWNMHWMWMLCLTKTHWIIIHSLFYSNSVSFEICYFNCHSFRNLRKTVDKEILQRRQFVRCREIITYITLERLIGLPQQLFVRTSPHLQICQINLSVRLIWQEA